jgi:hypothetical protein
MISTQSTLEGCPPGQPFRNHERLSKNASDPVARERNPPDSQVGDVRVAAPPTLKGLEFRSLPAPEKRANPDIS